MSNILLVAPIALIILIFVLAPEQFARWRGLAEPEQRDDSASFSPPSSSSRTRSGDSREGRGWSGSTSPRPYDWQRDTDDFAAFYVETYARPRIDRG